jgi:cysteine desulfurase/selenocysteine lyase
MTSKLVITMITSDFSYFEQIFNDAVNTLPDNSSRALAAVPSPFDARAVRHDFPILSERVNGWPLCWLDNAATTQKPRCVIDALTCFYEHVNSNIHRGAHTLARRATDAYEGARATAARFLSAESTDEIVFVRGATEGINLVARSYGAAVLKQDDEVLITDLEHHADIVPWQLVCRETGARLVSCPVDDRGDVVMAAFGRLLSHRTRIAALTHVSNVIGTVTPVRELTELAHCAGAVVLVDGAQAVAHMPVDVRTIGCDFYVFSGHKVFAPSGIGVLYGKKTLLDGMKPFQGGGSMIENVTLEESAFKPPPHRFEAGTGSLGDAVALGAALDYLSALGLNDVCAYESGLTAYAYDALSHINGLRVVGCPARRSGVLSFTLDGYTPEDVAAALDRAGIAVRSGLPGIFFGHNCTADNHPGRIAGLFQQFNRMVDLRHSCRH